MNPMVTAYDRLGCGSSVALIYVATWFILQRITYDCGTPLDLPIYTLMQDFLAFGVWIKCMDS